MSLSPLQWTHAPDALLGVNIDHVATVRNARGGLYPDPVALAQVAVEAGADIITFHLREDRRHIKDVDVERMKAQIKAPLNFEAAVTDEMIALIERIQPEHVCLVPERRQEITTEGGLDVRGQLARVKDACTRLAAAGSRVSLFIGADLDQICAAAEAGAPVIELAMRKREPSRMNPHSRAAPCSRHTSRINASASCALRRSRLPVGSSASTSRG